MMSFANRRDVRSNFRPIRILIVDPHEAVRQGLALLLSQKKMFEVVDHVGTSDAAFLAAICQKPDIILLDGEGPLQAPFEYACSELLRIAPKSRILVFSNLSARRKIQPLLKAGIHGFLFKHVAMSELFEAIRKVAGGSVYLPASLELNHHSSNRTHKKPSTLLTKRQLQVLSLMVHAETNRVIAGQMGISVETVHSHVKAILRKLNVATRTHAVAKGIQHGLIALYDHEEAGLPIQEPTAFPLAISAD